MQAKLERLRHEADAGQDAMAGAHADHLNAWKTREEQEVEMLVAERTRQSSELQDVRGQLLAARTRAIAGATWKREARAASATVAPPAPLSYPPRPLPARRSWLGSTPRFVAIRSCGSFANNAAL